MRVLIAVTHLLGAGHLTRAAALARALAAAGHDATLVSGGTPSPLVATDGVTFVQLPPVRARGIDFKELLDGQDRPVRDDLLQARRKILLAALEAARPDVLVTELFPFGRRMLADEFLALLEAARARDPKPLVVSSIRDILVAPTKPGRIEETYERLSRFYDAVLVHGDPDLVPLDASWPVDERLRALMHYTGYVDEGAAVAATGPREGILVSGGSSTASLSLYRAALEAASRIRNQHWRVLVGSGVPDPDVAALRSAAPAHVTVERARPDFRALLSRAALSVSQAGYNTVVDLLRAGVASVLVPFEAGRETEQRLRAERLKARNLAEIVPETELNAGTLADAVSAVLGRPPAPVPQPCLDGAGRTVALIESLPRSGPATASRTDWSALDTVLERSRDAGYAIEVWWRDDDAVAATPELERLLGLGRRYGAPVALAAIPHALEPSLSHRLAEEPLASVLVHGWAHVNHAPAPEKKAEFGDHRPLATMKVEGGQALERVLSAFGPKALPVFVPPWNRIASSVVAALPEIGYRGLSTFNDRTSCMAAAGLAQVNTHVDPIDWRGHRGLVEPQRLVAAIADLIERRLTGRADPREPIGILTHHLAHAEQVWSFCDSLFERLARNNIRLSEPVRVFSQATGSS
jgi:predicted glycosyltransferase